MVNTEWAYNKKKTGKKMQVVWWMEGEISKNRVHLGRIPKGQKQVGGSF